MIPVNLIPGAVSELLATVSSSRRITQADRYGLLAAVLDESITEEERCAIDRVLRSLCRGRIEVVNDLSALL